MSALADRDIVMVPAGTPPLGGAEIAKYRPLLSEAWILIGGEDAAPRRLQRTFATANFADAMALAARLASLADQVNHHPELTIALGRLTMTIWTHTAGGLTGNDFIFAAKVDQLLAP